MVAHDVRKGQARRQPVWRVSPTPGSSRPNRADLTPPPVSTLNRESLRPAVNWDHGPPCDHAPPCSLGCTEGPVSTTRNETDGFTKVTGSAPHGGQLQRVGSFCLQDLLGLISHGIQMEMETHAHRYQLPDIRNQQRAPSSLKVLTPVCSLAPRWSTNSQDPTFFPPPWAWPPHSPATQGCPSPWSLQLRTSRDLGRPLPVTGSTLFRMKFMTIFIPELVLEFPPLPVTFQN